MLFCHVLLSMVFLTLNLICIANCQERTASRWSLLTRVLTERPWRMTLSQSRQGRRWRLCAVADSWWPRLLSSPLASVLSAVSSVKLSASAAACLGCRSPRSRGLEQMVPHSPTANGFTSRSVAGYSCPLAVLNLELINIFRCLAERCNFNKVWLLSSDVVCRRRCRRL